MIKVSRMADYAVLLVCKMSKNQDKFYEVNGVGDINEISARIFNTIDNKI